MANRDISNIMTLEAWRGQAGEGVTKYRRNSGGENETWRKAEKKKKKKENENISKEKAISSPRRWLSLARQLAAMAIEGESCSSANRIMREWRNLGYGVSMHRRHRLAKIKQWQPVSKISKATAQQRGVSAAHNLARKQSIIIDK